MKLAGGTLGSAASVITGVLDIRDGFKFVGQDKTQIGVLCAIKGTVGLVSGGLTLAATFTYSAPLIGRLTGNAALGSITKIVGARAAAVIGVRILFMSAGAWATVVIFGIQVFIWVMIDDALEDWCSLCAFGARRKGPDGYRSVKEQESAVRKASVAIGLRDEEVKGPSK